MRNRLATVVSLLSSLATSAPGQDRPPGLDLRQVAGISRGDDGAPTAIGANYRATFADGGMTFVPALGDAAPERQPWSLRLRSIARGDNLLVDAASAPTAPVAAVDERRLECHRGEVIERYDVRPDGVELSYVFAERPAGEGDLVVRSDVTTPAMASPTGDGGYRFVDPRWGGVQLGAVTGIAADGERCAGTMQFADGVLSLTLPASFVADAAYPLVLDPLIGTAFPVALPIADSNVEVAYEGVTNNYLVVWQRGVAGSAREIYGQRFTSAGAPNGAPFAIAGGALVDPTNPTVCATSAQGGRFVVAWQEAIMFSSTVEVRGRTVSASTGAMGAASTWSSGTPRTNPVLGGGPGAASANTVLAWRRPGVGVEMRRVAVAAAGAVSLGSISTAISTANAIQSGPQMTKVRSGSGVGVVTVETSVGSNSTLTVRAFDGNGAPLGSQLPTVVAFAGAVRHAVATNGTGFLLAYTQGNVQQAQLTWNGASLAAGTPQVLLSGATVRDLALGWLGDRYLCVWEEDVLGVIHGVRGMTVKQNGTICSAPFILPVGANVSQTAPAIASEAEGGDAGDTCLFAWTEISYSSLTTGVFGQRFEAMAGLPPVQLSPGCSGGGSLTANGPFALGNESFAFLLNGGDPTAPFAVLGLTDGSTTPVTCGCTFTQSLATMLALPTAGSAQMPFALPCNPTLVGFQLEVQWFLVGGTVSPCGLVQGFTGSNRLRFTVAE